LISLKRKPFWQIRPVKAEIELSSKKKVIMPGFKKKSEIIDPYDVKNNGQEIEVGKTQDLNLRVSVASLVRLLFDNPENNQTMVALERTATFRKTIDQTNVIVRAKPFGGGVRLTNPQALKSLVGDFNYDSEQSRREKDFRILIRKTCFTKIKDICIKQWEERKSGILDFSPERELSEEFADTLHVKITPDMYRLIPCKIVIEDRPVTSASVRAAGLPTVRIYFVFEAVVDTPDFIAKILTNSQQYSDEDLKKIALNNVRQGGKGRANAVLALGLDELKDVYHSIPINRRKGPIQIKGHQLDGNVPVILF
jgi:hypothetical protein